MKMKLDLTTQIGDLQFKNPITVASGTFGTKDEYAEFVNYEHLGAMITKTITVKPRVGNPMPRIYEVAGGMLNAIGLQNKGLSDFIENKIPYFSKIKTPLIVNIAGETVEDFKLLTKTLSAHKKVVKALELNLSCPNVEAGGAGFMKKRERILDVIKTVRDHTDLTLFAKISPELGDVLEISQDAIRSGANGLSIMNTLKGMAIDIERKRPQIANVTGGLSGSAIKPVALRYVYEVKKNLDVPIIASGGITTWRDAVEFLMAGATLLAVGTANFVNPRATMEILEGLKTYMEKHQIDSLEKIRGIFRLALNDSGTSCGG